MKRKSTKYLTALLICLCVLLNNGCYKIYFYKNYSLKVVDAESNQPIESALVRVDYFMSGGGFFIPHSPKRMTARTDANGKVKLKYATNPGMWQWLYYIEAEGYIRFNPFLAMDNLHPYNQVNKGEYVAALYSKPDPKIEIFVPDDYQGPVAIEFIKTNDTNHSEPGQRLFSYHIQPNGYLPVKILPLFAQSQLIDTADNHIYSAESDNTITAKRENGSIIIHIGGQHEPAMESSGQEPEIESDSIAFRYVCSDGLKILCHIGTEYDRNAMSHKIFPNNNFHLNRNIFNSYFKSEKVQ